MRAPVVQPSRRNFLRLRLWTTAGGAALLALAAVPWLLALAAWLELAGGWRIFLVLACIAWGALFLPLAWLGWRILRLAWRPVAVRRGREVIEGERVE